MFPIKLQKKNPDPNREKTLTKEKATLPDHLVTWFIAVHKSFIDSKDQTKSYVFGSVVSKFP